MGQWWSGDWNQASHPCPTVLFHNIMCLSQWLFTRLALLTGHAVFHSPPLDQKSPPFVEAKLTASKLGKEERKGTAQEKKQLGIREKEDKKSAKLPGKEACGDLMWASGGAVAGGRSSSMMSWLSQ